MLYYGSGRGNKRLRALAFRRVAWIQTFHVLPHVIVQPERHPAAAIVLAGGSEPIAIVGMACRFPGANGVAAFWRLPESGANAVQEGVPGFGIGRIGALFPEDAGQIQACRFGACLHDLD